MEPRSPEALKIPELIIIILKLVDKRTLMEALVVNKRWFECAILLLWRKANLGDLALIQAADRRQSCAEKIRILRFPDGKAFNDDKTRDLAFPRLRSLRFKRLSDVQLLAYLKPCVKRLKLMDVLWSDDDFSAAAKLAGNLKYIRLRNMTERASSAALANFLGSCVSAERIEVFERESFEHHEGVNEYHLRLAELRHLKTLDQLGENLTAATVGRIAETVDGPFASLRLLSTRAEAATLPKLCRILPVDSLRGLSLDTTHRDDGRPGPPPPRRRVNLKDMARLTGLQGLHLTFRHDTVDTAPLSELWNMRNLGLHCHWGGPKDVKFLSGMARLQDLHLTFWTNFDMAPLSRLVNLQRLQLRTTNRQKSLDVRFLADLHNLQDLHLTFSTSFHTAPLSGLVSLRRLQLNALSHPETPSHSRPGILDMRFLANLRSLQELMMTGVHDFDVVPLSGLLSLRKLQLGYAHPGPLHARLPSGLPDLRELRISPVHMEEQPVDATPLPVPANLRKLDLVVTCRSTDLCLKPLARFTSLRVLKLRIQGIQQARAAEPLYRIITIDTEPLSRLINLRTLDVTCNWYSSLFYMNTGPLSRLTNLRVLRVHFREKVHLDIEPLSQLTKLRKLRLECAFRWRQLRHLSSLRRLESLNLENDALLADLAWGGGEGHDAITKLLAPLSRLRRLRLWTGCDELRVPVHVLSALGRHCPTIVDCEIAHLLVTRRDLERCEAQKPSRGFCEKLFIRGFLADYSRRPGSELAARLSYISLFRKKFPAVKRVDVWGCGNEFEKKITAGLRFTPRDNPSRDDSGVEEPEIKESDEPQQRVCRPSPSLPNSALSQLRAHGFKLGKLDCAEASEEANTDGLRCLSGVQGQYSLSTHWLLLCRSLKKTCNFTERPKDPYQEKIDALSDQVSALKRQLDSTTTTTANSHQNCLSTGPGISNPPSQYPAHGPPIIPDAVSSSTSTQSPETTTGSLLPRRRGRRSHFIASPGPLPDLLSAGLLTPSQAALYHATFFSGCDRYVPVFSPATHDTLASLRQRSPLLLAAVCTVGCRVACGTDSHQWRLLNFHLSRMLSHVTSSSSSSSSSSSGLASLETVQAFLVRACYSAERSLLVASATRLAVEMGLPDAFDELMAGGPGAEEDEARLVRCARTWLHVLVLSHILHVDAGDALPFRFSGDPRRARGVLLNSPHATPLDRFLLAQVELNVLRARLLPARPFQDDDEMQCFVREATLDIDLWHDDWERILLAAEDGEASPWMLVNLAVQRCWATTTALCRAVRAAAGGVDDVDAMTPAQRAVLVAARGALRGHLRALLAEPRRYLRDLRYAMDFVWAKCAFCYLLLLKLCILLPGGGGGGGGDDDDLDEEGLVACGAVLAAELGDAGVTQVANSTARMYLQLLQTGTETFARALQRRRELPGGGDQDEAAAGGYHPEAAATAADELDAFVPDQFVFEWDFPGLTLFSSSTTGIGWLDDILLGALNGGGDFYGFMAPAAEFGDPAG
ncbi:C6 zinc finger domain protein [Cordyceps fumosorosea ARSEF 2679]|uniref:C6 zinc finger domain protein n=1 Tax=Cordyceps fumosorosea (strain ARSEF 2679) TaxID=1081104 RepID=A0A167YFY4_CORFA|nr:C6 zinc finger domain protein [Cordyceps fumosorosea ARSEF 2679]OAA66277.1 C6 zinc finger domain protein [Cordyceps fumosorosea ARSEF 2679]